MESGHVSTRRIESFDFIILDNNEFTEINSKIFAFTVVTGATDGIGKQYARSVSESTS